MVFNYLHLFVGIDVLNVERKKRAETQMKTQSEFCQEVTKLTNGLFEVVGEYKGAFRTVKIKHLSCGKLFQESQKLLTNHRVLIVVVSTY